MQATCFVYLVPKFLLLATFVVIGGCRRSVLYLLLLLLLCTLLFAVDVSASIFVLVPSFCSGETLITADDTRGAVSTFFTGCSYCCCCCCCCCWWWWLSCCYWLLLLLLLCCCCTILLLKLLLFLPLLLLALLQKNCMLFCRCFNHFCCSFCNVTHFRYNCMPFSSMVKNI